LLRTDDVLPAKAERWVVAAINQHASELLAGALVVIDCSTARVRILPL
jgi:hypothetical protein